MAAAQHVRVITLTIREPSNKDIARLMNAFGTGINERNPRPLDDQQMQVVTDDAGMATIELALGRVEA